MRNLRIEAIRYFAPARTLTGDDLKREFPSWNVDAVQSKLGIHKLPIAAENECGSDLATVAAKRLLADLNLSPEDIHFLIYCTQSPDYLVPGPSARVHANLGFRSSCGALDLSLGCSGYVYGLAVAAAMISSGLAENVLFLTADTYSKYIARSNKACLALFGDAASATLISQSPSHSHLSGPFLFGTDGNGELDLFVKNSACRGWAEFEPEGQSTNRDKKIRTLEMNGPKVFNFVVNTIPAFVTRLLKQAALEMCDVDLFFFHQANAYILAELATVMDIPHGKLIVDLEDHGNTTSSSIPIALARAMDAGKVKPGCRLLLVSFGVGYSWAGTVVRW